MSAINLMNVDYYTPSTPVQARGAADELNKDQFLQLLITQLTHQDPMSPMENMDFTAQLASLQALDEQMKTNKVMTAMRVDTQIASVSQMIGRIVTGLDGTGQEITGIVKHAVVEGEEVLVETTSGQRIALDNIRRIWNPESKNTAAELTGAWATLGALVNGTLEDGRQHAGIVVAVSADASGKIRLVLHDGNTIDYDKITEISDWVAYEEPDPEIPGEPGEPGEPEEPGEPGDEGGAEIPEDDDP